MTNFYEVPKGDTSDDNVSTNYKPLSATITGHIAETLCGIIDINQPPSLKSKNLWDDVKLPELLYFIQKVTTKAMVDVQTTIALLVLASRFKDNLPKNAHGETGTYHKIFLTSLLIASKEFTPKTEEEKQEEELSANSNDTELDNDATDENENDDDENDENDEDDANSDTNSNLSKSPESLFDHPIGNNLSITPCSTFSILDDDDPKDCGLLLKQIPSRNISDYKDIHIARPTINRKFSKISTLYTEQELDLMEREFMWRLNSNNKVTKKDIQDYVENNKPALGLC